MALQASRSESRADREETDPSFTAAVAPVVDPDRA